MLWITAERATYLKKLNKPAADLPSSQKRAVAAGTRYPVKSYEELRNFHWLVKLEDGDWLIFDNGTDGAHSHWTLSWQDDAQEHEQTQPAAITSNVPNNSFIGVNLEINMPFSTRITPHITYGEFALYQEARRFDFEHQARTAYELALFLERCRKHFGGKSVRVHSGYRPPKINKQVGGASRSEHLFSAPMVGAVDFSIAGVNIYEVQDYCLKHWGASVGKGAKRGFIHLGMRGSKNRQIVWNY
ncbi:MAG: D-Ala-D-Ala carboxypeptidase family metallohydrolase [Cyanobacteria bacterium J06597_16]